MKYKFKNSKRCTYLGIKYHYVIGVGWVHTDTLKPITVSDFKSLKDYNEFTNELEYMSIQEDIKHHGL